MTVSRHVEEVASPQRLRVGAGVVDFATREIEMPGARRSVRVTPKALAVLRVLARSSGAVFSRNDLLAEAWPDTMPTDDVLTQAITQLRKAFGHGDIGADEGRRYIETIAKSGYRLTVPVSVLELPALEQASVAHASLEHASPASPVSIDAPPAVHPAAASSSAPFPSKAEVAAVPGSAPAWRHAAWWAGAVLALVAIGLVSLMLVARQISGSRPAPTDAAAVVQGKPYRLVTSAAGFELSPSLSPDASRVAYSARTLHDGTPLPGPSILIQSTTDSAPQALSVPAAGERDDLPVWSPDGGRIAFARWDGAGGCRIMLAAVAVVGQSREIARCDGSELLSFDWLPDGSGLLFGTMTGSPDGAGMRVFDLATGGWRAIRYPAAAGDIDYLPKVSPDGRWIAFLRNPQLGDLWRIPFDGGEAEQLTQLGAELRGLSWTPDSQSLVYGRRIDSETRLHRLDLGTRTISDLGIEDAQMPAIARNADLIAFVHRQPQFALNRIDAVSGHRERLFASSGRDTQPVVAPDGRQLVFTSDRSGSSELWWADLERPDSLRPIPGVRPDTQQPPVWSADSRRVLISALDVHARPGIVEIEPASGAVTTLPVPAAHPLQAVYGEGDGLFVIEEEREGRTALVAYDRRWRVRGRIDGVSHVQFDAQRSRVLYTRLDGKGIWSARVDLAQPQRLSADIPSRWRYRSWALTSDGHLSYLDSDSGCRSKMTRFVIADGGLDQQDEHCLDASNRSTVNGFSGHRQDWLVSIAVDDGTDIGVMAMPDASNDDRSLIAKLLIALRRKAS
ncbi:winged helix-turn-helix domain-containing protein [Luteimonas sp. TWI1416]|uniref:winged helix-turn-helix domain-containing protein n=1 Tax=unclassified Luteimonas TaxID=2629088 RepID=UPI0032094390